MTQFRFWFRFTFAPQRAWVKSLTYWDEAWVQADTNSHLWFV